MPKALSNFEVNIGKKVRNYRVTNDYTQEELAKYLKLPKQVISRMENGKRRIMIEELEKIALFFDQPTQLFLNDDYKYIYSNPLLDTWGCPFPVYMQEFLIDYSKGLMVRTGKDNLTNRYINEFIAAIKQIRINILKGQKFDEKK